MATFIGPESLLTSEAVGVGWAARELEIGEATVRRLGDSGQLRMYRLEHGQRFF